MWLAVGVLVAVAAVVVVGLVARRAVRQRRPVEASADVIDIREARPAAADDVIPGYDSLRATDVVAALRDLDRDGLVIVREHEASTKARKTVLTKIDSLVGA